MKTRLLLATLVAGLLGCAAPATRMSELTPIEATGEYRHEPSHMLFPDNYGIFRRVSLSQRGDNTHIVAGYAGGSPSCLAVVTFFVDPVAAGESTPTTFARASGETLRAHPSAILESEDIDPQSPWQRAIYVDGDKRVELGLRRQGRYDVVDRTVYPVRCIDELGPKLTEFLPWKR
jgi:hypothetical protein